MQPFSSSVAGRIHLQGPFVSVPAKVSVSGRRVQLLTPAGAVSESANGNGKVHNKQLKFYYFDPLNPEDVREVVAKQHDTKSQHHTTNNNHGSGHTSSSYNGNGHYSNHGAPALAHSNGHSSTQLAHVRDASKDLTQLQRLSTQLEEANSALAKFQQYEALYKETRMRSKQMQLEVAALQQLLAEKDAELARQYKRMELEASERSGLRTQFTTALDEVKALRHELEEARQAMLELKGVIPANVTLRRGLRPSGTYMEEGGGGGTGGSGSADVLTSLQGLAKQLAEGMEHEVGSLLGMPSGKHQG